MSSASNVSTYRPAVIALTGIAAACGIYAVYTALSNQPPKRSLHRSNAVYRRRRRDHGLRSGHRLNSMCISVPPGVTSEEDPINVLGAVDIQSPTGEANLRVVGGEEKLPNIEFLQRVFGVLGQELHDLAARHLICSMLSACAWPTSPEDRAFLESQYGLGELASVLEQRPLQFDEICRFYNKINSLLGGVREGLAQTIIKDWLFDCHDSGVPVQFAAGELLPNNTDVRGFAETDENEPPGWTSQDPGQDLKGLIYYIAEDNAKRKAYEHRGIRCEECGEQPIRNIRWHCLNCPDFDLCSTCETSSQHPKTHVFAKISIPLPSLCGPHEHQPPWYPGETRLESGRLGPILKKRLADETLFEQPSIDALYDQFITIANIPWSADPAEIHVAIDREAFRDALIGRKFRGVSGSDVLCERVFLFYAATERSLIGFKDFVRGMAYLRGRQRFMTLHLAVQGYDIDEDGYICRQDVLSLLEVKYRLQRELVLNQIRGRQSEQDYSVRDVLRSSQPLSSVFQEDIPPGERRTLRGKRRGPFGDMRPVDGGKVLLDDDDNFEPSGEASRTMPGAQSSLLRLREQLSRFEELLHDVAGPDGPQFDENPFMAALPDRELDEDDLRKLGLEAPLEDLTHQDMTQDVLWLAVQDNLSALLDPLFGARESADHEVMATRADRKRWRSEIEEWRKRKHDLEKSLASGAYLDPLLATASAAQISMEGPNSHTVDIQQEVSAAFVPGAADLVPTDHESLDRLEADISNKSLEELLRESGYATIDGHGVEDRGDKSPKIDVTQMDEVFDWQRDGKQDDAGPQIRDSQSARDPTLPQNMPDANLQLEPDKPVTVQDEDQPLGDSLAQEVATKPSDAELGRLAALDAEDREMEERGGPGRLSLDEIIDAVNHDTSQRLKGVIVCWLEWASF